MEELNAHIRLLREDFSHGKLDESDLLPDPHLQFEKWLAQAVEAQLSEVQAMNLATISEAGQPSSRIVYLREFNASGFCFYTNYQSDKAADIAFNPRVALNFFWKELERQVRIEGLVEKVSEAPTLSDVTKTVTNNYTTYYECAVKNDAWIEWYESLCQEGRYLDQARYRLDVFGSCEQKAKQHHVRK